MLKKFLKEISKNKIDLISFKKINGIILNKDIFGNNIPDDLIEYKIIFLSFLEKKRLFFLDIKNNIENINFTINERNILLNEIFIELNKIDFLIKVYDIEANKINKNFKIKELNIDYDFYNKIFFGVEKLDIGNNFIITKNKEYNLFISKNDLEELLNKANNIIENKIKWNFGDFTNMAHSNGVIKIPNKIKYNIREVIVLFFHELTHLFRYINTKRNIGFYYTFGDYNILEEGIAQYNEFLYGNEIIDYGKFIPYYNICYSILLKDISEDKKKEEIYLLLKNKGFSKEKSIDYYYRFYRYSVIGTKNFFLKDLIYNKSYNLVKGLIDTDIKNYEKIMYGKIGKDYLNLISNINNIDSRKFFNNMEILIKEQFNL